MIRVSLVALPEDLGEEVPLATTKVSVLEGYGRLHVRLHLVEVVHVQLPDERVEVLVLEVFGDDLFDELLLVQYGERQAFRLVPLDETRVTGIGNDVVHLLQE